MPIKKRNWELEYGGIHICVGEHVGKPYESIYEFKQLCLPPIHTWGFLLVR